MNEFIIYCDDEEFPQENVTALAAAMQGFVETDVPLAVEFVFVDGEEDLIPNSERTFFVRASTIVCGVLVAISAFFLVWVCKVRYYMYQEDTEKLAENKN